MLKHISLLSAAALAATLSGLVREATLAYVFGTSQYADATATAIFLHDTIAAAFITGGFTFAVVPLLGRYRAAGNDTDAIRLVTATTAWIVILAAVIAFTGFSIIPPLVHYALRDDPRRAVTMTVILASALPALAIITVASAIAAFLPGFDHFHQPSVARLLWNLGISAGLLLVPRLGAPAGVSIALVTGAVVNLLVVTLSLPGREHQEVILSHPGLRDLVKLAAPSLFVIAAINAALGLWERYLLARVGVGSIAVVNYAQRTTYMASTVSAAVHVVAFTEMSKYTQAGTMAPAGLTAVRGLTRRYLLFLVPLMCFMVAARTDIVTLLFARGAFTAESVTRTATAFGVYATAILPVFLLGLYVRVLFTLDRPWLAIRLLGLSAVVSALADRMLVAKVGELAIPAGYSLGTLVGAALAAWYVERRVSGSLLQSVGRALLDAFAIGATGMLCQTLLFAVASGNGICTGSVGSDPWCLGARLTLGLFGFAVAALVTGRLLRIGEVQAALRWVQSSVTAYVRS